jgi:hypothetical protein
MLIGSEFTAFNQRLKISRSKEASNRQSKVLKVSKAGIRLRWNGRCMVMRSEWALTQSHIPLRKLWPFKAAKIMAVMRLVRGYRRPYLLLGSGIWANISSRSYAVGAQLGHSYRHIWGVLADHSPHMGLPSRQLRKSYQVDFARNEPVPCPTSSFASPGSGLAAVIPSGSIARLLSSRPLHALFGKSSAPAERSIALPPR